MLRIINSKDFLSGVLFLLVGSGVCLIAWGYPMGTAAVMGPGYFPLIVGALLAFFGATLIAISLRTEGAFVEISSPRALLCIIGSILAFGVLFKFLGLVLTALLSTIIASLASPESRMREVVILYLCLVGFLTGVFVLALALPIPLWPAI